LDPGQSDAKSIQNSILAVKTRKLVLAIDVEGCGFRIGMPKTGHADRIGSSMRAETSHEWAESSPQDSDSNSMSAVCFVGGGGQDE
jgi:hypothetical protein